MKINKDYNMIMKINKDYNMIMREGKRLLKGNTDMSSDIYLMEVKDKFKPFNFVWIGLVAAIMALILIFTLSVFAQAKTISEDKAIAKEIKEIDAIKSCLGEAEGEPYEGKLAIMGALRNRGSLRGVYGYKAISFKNGHYYRGRRKISSRIVEDAETAWIESSQVDESNGATGWGNDNDINKFCSSSWWSKCIITAHIGNHWFYRQINKEKL